MAVLMQALAPAISQVLSTTGDEAALWRESICSAQSLDWAASSPADAPADTQPTRRTGVCPYCGTQFFALAVAIDAPLDFSMRGAQFATPQGRDAPPELPYPWPRAHARAPPSRA